MFDKSELMFPADLAQAMSEKCNDLGIDQISVGDLENCLYHIMAICENDLDFDYWRTFYTALSVIIDNMRTQDAENIRRRVADGEKVEISGKGYTPTIFYYENEVVYCKNKALGYFKHPSFTLGALLYHMEKMKNEGFNVEFIL